MDAITIIPWIPYGSVIGRKVAKQNGAKRVNLQNRYRMALEQSNKEIATSDVVQQQEEVTVEEDKVSVAKSDSIKKMFDLVYYEYLQQNLNFIRDGARKLRVNRVVTDNTKATRDEISLNGKAIIIEGEKVEEPIVSEPQLSDELSSYTTKKVDDLFEKEQPSFSRVSRLANDYKSEVAHQVELPPKSSEDVLDKYNSLMHSGDNPDLIDIDLEREESKIAQIKEANAEKLMEIEKVRASVEQLEKAYRLKEVKEELLEQTTEYNSLTQELEALRQRQAELMEGMSR